MELKELTHMTNIHLPTENEKQTYIFFDNFCSFFLFFLQFLILITEISIEFQLLCLIRK